MHAVVRYAGIDGAMPAVVAVRLVAARLIATGRGYQNIVYHQGGAVFNVLHGRVEPELQVHRLTRVVAERYGLRVAVRVCCQLPQNFKVARARRARFKLGGKAHVE